MKTILVVDDMAIFREPLAAILRNNGYRTVCAANGKEALNVFREQRPDLILLDLAMPEIDGLHFLRNMAADPYNKKPPVIVLTALQDKESILAAGKLGVREFMLKSQFSLDQLLVRVKRCIEMVAARPAAAKNAATDTSEKSAPDEKGESDAASSTQAADKAATPAGAASAVEVSQASAVVDTFEVTSLEALKSLKPIVTRSDVQTRIDAAGELKAMSPTVAQVLKLTGSPRCSIENVAKAIKQDQAVALKVLKLANSVVYTRGEPVESVQKAVMRIGLSQIRQAVLNISVIDSFKSKNGSEMLNGPQFWEHSIACGLIASELTRAVGGKNEQIDTAFTMGLLHDVGRMVYMEHMNEHYTQVLEKAHELQLPLEQVEQRMMLISHADMMDRVLHMWRFPNDLINPIAMHHLSVSNIRHMASNMVEPVCLLALANRLAHALMIGSSGNQAIYSTVDFVKALKLKPDVILDIEKIIPEQATDLKFALLANSEEQTWLPYQDQNKQRLTQPFRAIFVGTDPQVDGYRILCDRLRTAGEQDPPNVAVVHITDQRDRIKLTNDLKQAEAAQNLGPLPLVIISPKGDILLEPSEMPKRRYRPLSSPMTMLRLINAINAAMNSPAAANGKVTQGVA